MKLMSLASLMLAGAGAARLAAQGATVSLPAVMVYSPSVANQEPAAAFAMPVSALRFEPLADIEPRNMAEAQADVTIRGDIFENTGQQLGALSIFDPQTGHYLTEIPVAPAMLGAPRILTGADHALETMNSMAGAVAYDWRPIQQAGFVTGALGTDGLNRVEAYQGFVGPPGTTRIGADADVAHASGNGTVAFGDYHFDRAGARLQLGGKGSQTDLVAGYQASFFGWPNLYTPFNSDETENLQTVLLALNHRENLGGGDYLEAGAFYRRNKDDYAFNRFAPLRPVHPFQHTTWISGAAIGGRDDIGGIVINYHAEATADSLKSTALVFGPYHRQTLEKLAFVPEESWALADGAVVLKAGGTFDSSNRNGRAYSPVAELARTWRIGPVRRLYGSYSATTEVPSYTALDSSPTSGLFLGNPGLGRETSRNSEIGASGLVGNWTGQAAVFYRRDDNLVDWTYQQGVFGRRANPVNIGTSGLELVARRDWAYCSLVLGYTALAKSSDYHGAPVTASFYALNYARQRLTAAITLRLTETFVLRMDNSARIQAADSLRTAGGNDAVTSALALAWRPEAWPRLEFSVQVDNLWNSAFQAVPGVPASRRQVSFGGTYAW